MVRDASKSFLSAKTTLVRRRSVIAKRETSWVEQFVRSQIIQHWQANDDPEHLRTIRDRLLFNEHGDGRLQGLQAN